MRKPAVRPLGLLAAAARSRRSLVHVRFDSDELVAAIERADADVFVAEHSYMAESFLPQFARSANGRLVVNTHVSRGPGVGSQPWTARTRRGQAAGPRRVAGGHGRRCRRHLRRRRGGACTAATAFAVRGGSSSRCPRRSGRRLDDASATGADGHQGLAAESGGVPARARAVAAHLRRACRTPNCASSARRSRTRPNPTYPAGVRDLGFVDDLHAFLGTCRAMVAPIKTGGGVRVKILDAARIGLAGRRDRGCGRVTREHLRPRRRRGRRRLRPGVPTHADRPCGGRVCGAGDLPGQRTTLAGRDGTGGGERADQGRPR